MNMVRQTWRRMGRLRAILALTLGLFFMYTGLELTVGSWGYTLLTAGHHLPRAAAAFPPSLRSPAIPT